MKVASETSDENGEQLKAEAVPICKLYPFVDIEKLRDRRDCVSAIRTLRDFSSEFHRNPGYEAAGAVCVAEGAGLGQPSRHKPVTLSPCTYLCTAPVHCTCALYLCTVPVHCT